MAETKSVLSLCVRCKSRQVNTRYITGDFKCSLHINFFPFLYISLLQSLKAGAVIPTNFTNEEREREKLYLCLHHFEGEQQIKQQGYTKYNLAPLPTQVGSSAKTTAAKPIMLHRLLSLVAFTLIFFFFFFLPLPPTHLALHCECGLQITTTAMTSAVLRCSLPLSVFLIFTSLILLLLDSSLSSLSL